MGLLNSLASNVRRGGVPVIRRKRQSFFSSLGGAVIGLGLMVIGSPLAAWYAESQHREKDFLSAQQVSADVVQDGYVVIEAPVTVAEPISCYSDATTATDSTSSCVYSTSTVEEYTRSEKKQCGSFNSNQEVIRQLPTECDSDGNNCENCAMVAEYDWEAVVNGETETKTTFTVGAYTVEPSAGVDWFNNETYIAYANTTAETPRVGDRRTTYTYFRPAQTVLVVGEAVDGKIISGGEKLFAVSNLGYAGTQTALASADNTMQWILRIASLVLMMFGAVLVVSPLTHFTNLFRFVPIVGRHLDSGLDSVIVFFAGLVGVVLWLLLWGLILVLKNIWLIII